jgi:FkbM family methyltransferase
MSMNFKVEGLASASILDMGIGNLKNYLTRIKTWISLFPLPVRDINGWYHSLLSAVPTEELSRIQEFKLRGGIDPRRAGSDHQKFWRDGGIELLASLEEVEDKCVIVLGGHLGESVERYLKFGARTIDVFEPVPEFFEKLESRFQSASKVNIVDKAAWVRNEKLEFWLDNEGTGFSGRSGTPITVEAIRLSTWLSGQEEGKQYFIEINIEGSEYELLEDLITSGMVSRLATILIQFHNFSPESERQRTNILGKLANSHFETMSYKWVWEKWVLRAT